MAQTEMLRTKSYKLLFERLYNLGEATAADPKTLQFLGALRIEELTSQTPGGKITRDQIKAGMRKQRQLRKGYAEYLAALGAMATSLDWRSEREELMARALANTGTEGRREMAAPGAARPKRLPPASSAPRTANPVFVSDAVRADAEIFDEIRMED